MSRRDRRRAEAQRRRAHKQRKQAEDKTIARRMVAEDLRRTMQELRELGQRPLTYDDPLPPDAGGREGLSIWLSGREMTSVLRVPRPPPRNGATSGASTRMLVFT
jgi:hypothetical protein